MVDIARGATIYLDTNALIYITEGAPRFKATIAQFLCEALDAKARLVTSELAITEVLVAPVRDENQNLIDAYSQLFEAFVEALPIARSILVRAAQLRAKTTRLRTPDAIHLATAEHVTADIFVTGDVGIPVSPPMARHLLVESA